MLIIFWGSPDIQFELSFGSLYGGRSNKKASRSEAFDVNLFACSQRDWAFTIPVK